MASPRTLLEFLGHLRRLDARLTLEGDRLSISAPQGALSEQDQAELAARKPEILAFLRTSQEDPGPGLTLQRAPADQPLPLSFAQQRLWFLQQLAPDDPVYNLGLSVRFPVSVDEAALSRALNALAGRHATLRTVFPVADGTPSQVVVEGGPRLEVFEVTAVTEARRAASVTRLRDTEIRRPFRLDQAPAFRAILIKSGPEAIVVLVVHHILADGWSLSLLVRELGELYHAALADASPSLVEPPWRYADYAYSQRSWFDQTDQTPHIEYWKRRLGGNLTRLNLPGDRSREQALGSSGAVERFLLPEPLAQRLRKLSRDSGVTLFTTMMAVFKVLLHRYSAQEDILVGTPMANRSKVELESLVGLFVSTTVLRTSLSGNPTFREVLRRVHEGMLDAHRHRDFPFEKLVELIRPDRSLAQSPLFQVAFILQELAAGASYEVTSGGAAFELSLFLWDGGGELPGSFEYNAELFDSETITRMIGHFLRLTEAAVTRPDEPVSRLPILPAAESTVLLETWNQTGTTYPRDRSVHALFERQAEVTPDAVAVIAPPADDGGSTLTLTYRELDRRSNQLAHLLHRLGVRQRSTVVIALPRSVDFIVSVLATLKAGATYVPIDRTQPADRITQMVQDADPAAIIGQGGLDPLLPMLGTRIVVLDAKDPRIDGEDASRLELTVAADDLAYVMYTSGSTGQPKGVCVPHRAIVRLVRNTNYVELSEDDAILACAPVSFDASTFEIWGCLLSGGRLVLYPRPLPDPTELGALIREYAVTTLWLTAGLFHLIVETTPEAFTGLRQLLAGGDVLSPPHVRKALAALSGGVVINGYGPTENTTFTCCHRMASADDVGDIVPIGRPISNTRVYVLDASMQPVPIGIRGELWTSGDGLARGYRTDPVLTAERFVPDPFSGDPGARLYRTGDVVRYRPDGVIEFLGRADSQVKIRGYRVEPGEVEHALREHPGVADAVAVARKHGDGRQLVAYVVPAKHQALARAGLKQFLQERLPDYAVPSAFVMLNGFPLTTNGKVDHDALPAPGDEAGDDTEFQSGLETQVALIWKSVLRLRTIGRRDNFFELGGNSLLGVRLLAALEKVLGKRIPVSVLYRGQTVESMAAVLGEDFTGALFHAVAIQPGGNQRPIFVVPGVEGNVIGYEALAKAMGPDQPLYGLRSVGLDGEAVPLEQVEVIAATFLAEMRKVQPKGPYRLVGFCMGGVIAYEMAQQLERAGQPPELVAMIDTFAPAAIPRKRRMNRLAQQIKFLSRGVSRHLRAAWKRPRGQRLRYLREKARIVTEMVSQRDIYRGEQYVLHRDLVTRANQRAAAAYVPRPYPGSILLILLLERVVSQIADPRQVWRSLAQNGCSLIHVHGSTSGDLLKEPHVQVVADAMNEWLAIGEAERAGAGPLPLVAVP